MAIDELHAGSLGDLAVLLNAVQNLTLDRQQNPLAIIGAGLPSVREILTQAATFGERSRWMGLQELSNSDLARALKLPAAELDVGMPRLCRSPLRPPTDTHISFRSWVQLRGVPRDRKQVRRSR